uniref:Uncharacterized protein n=1 Tax=Molossus molossus TaxID=27622 RepID=A0A7J8IZI2_MOLMO|nr:hypothetical protein HJG59_010364 [Molossus molossus]
MKKRDTIRRINGHDKKKNGKWRAQETGHRAAHCHGGTINTGEDKANGAELISKDRSKELSKVKKKKRRLKMVTSLQLTNGVGLRKKDLSWRLGQCRKDQPLVDETVAETSTTKIPNLVRARHGAPKHSHTVSALILNKKR